VSVFLELLHGRKSQDEDLEDWGTNGPVLGPFEWVHTTYAQHVRCGRDGDGYLHFFLSGDLLYYDGVYYGDWSVFDASVLEKSPDLKARLQEPDEAKTEMVHA
jgi:hypothetical protein